MSFLKNVIGAFSAAVKAGSEFNPVMEDVLSKLESLHASGKLDKVLYEAEQSYTAEHDAYMAKGTHTDAQDSQNDVRAMAHFMTALANHKDSLDPELKAEVEKLLAMKDQMENILGNILKKPQEG